MQEKNYPIRHRDFNWLSFNERVLQEAEDENNPLYERLKFLAIFSSNLDEFFRVRVSRLRQIKKIDKTIRKKLALRPNKQIKRILKRVKEQQERFGNIFYKKLIPELAENNIYILPEQHFDFAQEAFATEYFISKLLPEISHKKIDFSSKEGTFLDNNQLYLLVSFKDSDSFGLVNVPTDKLGRFLTFPSHQDKYNIAFIDDLIRIRLDQIFENEEISGCFEIKLSRDAELYIEDEFDGLLAEKIKNSLSQRKDGQPTRLLYDASMPKELRKKLRKLLGLGKIDMMPGGRYHNFSDFFNFPDPTDNSKLHENKTKPIPHSALNYQNNYFQQIADKDFLVHFPYMSFDYVQNFLDQAAEDDQVTEIKISLYRVAKESPLTNSLLKALKNGKKVMVFVEAKARFDEENNLRWGKIFEEEGANVYYSYPHVKVHSKILLISRKESDEIKRYAYIGTGNFNENTSKFYCDHGLFTANRLITKDLFEVFEVLAGNMILPKPKRLLISPFTTRTRFSELIDREILNAKNGKTGLIRAKLNSLEDEEIIFKLYEASNAGVKVDLLVRGFCCLVPQLEGVSENITVTSILDKYLEHGRVYYFHNDNNPEVFMGSADWMTRNLDKRIEVITPILDEDLKKELVTILDIQLSDNVKARFQDASESNTYVTQNGRTQIRSQIEIRKFLEKLHLNEKVLTKENT